MRVKDVFPQARFERLEQQVANLRDAASKDQNGRVEDGKVIGDRDAEVMPRALEGGDRKRIPFARLLP